MRILPRHYVFILAILGLAAFNIVRLERGREARKRAAVLVRGTSPVWTVFDLATKLRDSSDDDFQPARIALARALDDATQAPVTPEMSTVDLTNLRACQTWLLFYRQEVLHPSVRSGWKDQTLSHVKSCAADHTDVDNKEMR